MKAIKYGKQLYSVDECPYPNKFLKWAQTYFGGTGDIVDIRDDKEEEMMWAAFDLWLYIYEKDE